MDKLSKIILISGPTASGKSNFAVKIAKKINGEITHPAAENPTLNGKETEGEGENTSIQNNKSKGKGKSKDNDKEDSHSKKSHKKSHHKGKD